MPGIKPTNEQLDERISAVVGMICKAWRFSDIKRELRKLYGPLCHRTCSSYVASAKARILKELERPKTDFQSTNIGILYEIVRSGKTSGGAKVQAIALINELVGLDSAKRIEVSGPHGGPIESLTTLAHAAEMSVDDCQIAFEETRESGNINRIIAESHSSGSSAG